MSERSFNVGRYGGAELLTLAPRHGATHEAARSGSWSDEDTWFEDDAVPDAGANVLIDDGVTVTLSSQRDARLETIRVDGTLRFDANADTRLRVDTILVSKTGRIEIGTENDPVRPSHTAEIEFLQELPIEHPSDPLQAGRGLLVLGECEIYGAPKTAWDALASHATADDTSVTLAGNGPAALYSHGWQEGDEIVFPDQEPWGGVPEATADGGVSPTATRDDEVRTVTDVDGDTISFDESLDVDHDPPEGDLDSYVLNLSRSVRFSSEADDSDEQGHFMMASPGQSVHYLETDGVGRSDKKRPASNPLWNVDVAESESDPGTNRRGRYAIHFHRTGPTAATSTVQGCAIRDSPGWGAVNHRSSADFRENVAFDVDGCAFVTEAGGESGSMRRNFALHSVGSGYETDAWKAWENDHPSKLASTPNNVDDFGHHGGGFWIHSPIVEIEENVAAGHRGPAFEFWTRALHPEPLDLADNADVKQPIESGEALDGKHDAVPRIHESLLSDEEKRYSDDGTEEPPVMPSWHDRGSDWYYNQTVDVRQFDSNTAFASGAGVEFRSPSFRNVNPRSVWSELEGFTAYNVGEHFLEDGSTQPRFENFQSPGNVGIDHRYVGNMRHVGATLIGNGSGVGVSNNLAYTNGWDVADSEIRGWEYGFVPKRYSDEGHNEVTNTSFDNETADVLLKNKFPRATSGLLLEDCTFDGTNRLEWEIVHPSKFTPENYLVDLGSVCWNGRNVYHGWNDPDFVLVEEGDHERLEPFMGRESEWVEETGMSDPSAELPGKTMQELYDEYGILFLGGLQDPSQEDFERPDDFTSSGDDYGPAPYLGPANKTQPTDEIWVDVVERATLEGDYEVVSYGDDVQREVALKEANDRTAVELYRRNWDLDPIYQEGEGKASYTFEIDTPGTYQVLTRAQTAGDVERSNDTDSRFVVRIDGGSWTVLNSGGVMHAQNDFTWSNPEFLTFDLSSTGEHTIEVVGKGRVMRLDWLLICHETVAAASLGTGKDHTR